MTDCPFKLPLGFDEVGNFCGYIRETDGNVLAGRVIERRQALYIIRAVNNFEKMREALRPFAEAIDDLHEKATDGQEIWEQPAAMGITAGDIRRAAAVLKEIEDA